MTMEGVPEWAQKYLREFYDRRKSADRKAVLAEADRSCLSSYHSAIQARDGLVCEREEYLPKSAIKVAAIMAAANPDWYRGADGADLGEEGYVRKGRIHSSQTWEELRLSLEEIQAENEEEGELYAAYLASQDK